MTTLRRGFLEERERLTLKICALESAIDRHPRVYADDEFKMRELFAQVENLRGRLGQMGWVQAVFFPERAPMCLSNPLTKEELDSIEKMVHQGASLGLFRLGAGEEEFCAVSLLAKLIAEHREMRELLRGLE